MNLQGSNHGKVYGLAAKCQEITQDLRAAKPRAFIASPVRHKFYRRDADFLQVPKPVVQTGATVQASVDVYGLGTWPVNSRRISVSLALILTAFSLPRRIMIFWPADRSSRLGSAN